MWCWSFRLCVQAKEVVRIELGMEYEPAETKECCQQTCSGLNDIGGVVLGTVHAGSWASYAGLLQGNLGYWRQESCSGRRHLGQEDQKPGFNVSIKLFNC